MDETLQAEILSLFIRAQIRCLEAQLRALRSLGSTSDDSSAPRRGRPPSGKSQVDIVFDILRTAGSPLHIDEILKLAARRRKNLDRESVVSAITKYINRHERFVRTAPNTFAILDQEGVR
jgi:hypothetical protein